MISKLVWPHAHDKSNPFGGEEGFRPLRITFHSQSLVNLSAENAKALEMLLGIATLSQIDAMSFDGQVHPQIVIESKESRDGYFDLQIIDSNQSLVARHRGVHKSWLDEPAIVGLMELYGLRDEEKINSARQDFLHAKAHNALYRDIFITSSSHLIANRHKFEDMNVATPLEALKIVGIYLRTRNEYKWVLQVKGNITFQTSHGFFYECLAKGLLPSNWKYLSAFGFHPERDELVQLGWSILERCSRALQARDEIVHLYYMPETTSSEDLRSYHFDYLTLLLTAALDTQALIINKIYSLGLSNHECGLRRRNFKKAIGSNALTKDIENLLDSKKQFIDILFKLRNKIHSVSLKEDYHVPEIYPDELLENIYEYDPNNHWGVQRQKVTVIKNGGHPVSSFKYSLNIYSLGFYLIDETFALINILMEETKTEDFLEKSDLANIRINPPPETESYIQTSLLLG